MDARLTDNPDPVVGEEPLAGPALPAAADVASTVPDQAPAAVNREETANRRTAEISTLIDKAEDALATGRWRQARAALGVAMEDAAALPNDERERLAASTLAVATAAEANGHWRASGELLRQLAALGLAADETTARLEVVRHAEEGQAAVARAQAAFSAGRWQECLQEAEQALVGLPTSMAARELRILATSALEQEARRQRRHQLYHEMPAKVLRTAGSALQATGRGLSATGRATGRGLKAAAGTLGQLLPPPTPPLPNEEPARESTASAEPVVVPPPAPEKRPVLGELPADWVALEEPGEPNDQGQQDLGVLLGLSVASEGGVELARHYIAQNPTLDRGYAWLARHYLLRGSFDEGRQVLEDGLGQCAQRRRLCHLYGWLELEAGQLNQAAEWWLRSARLQLAVRRHDVQEPFLYLAYLALLYGLTARADEFFALVDQVHHLQLSDAGREELRVLASKADKKRIVEGIGALGQLSDELQ